MRCIHTTGDGEFGDTLVYRRQFVFIDRLNGAMNADVGIADIHDRVVKLAFSAWNENGFEIGEIWEIDRCDRGIDFV